MIHTVKGFGIVNKAEIDVFLELSCFFDDPADVGNLISGSSAFSKTSLNIWKLLGVKHFDRHLMQKMKNQCQEGAWLNAKSQGLTVEAVGSNSASVASSLKWE